MDRESTAGSKTQQGTGEEGERGGWGAGSSRLKDGQGLRRRGQRSKRPGQPGVILLILNPPFGSLSSLLLPYTTLCFSTMKAIDLENRQGSLSPPIWFPCG